jgi:hypothetical protein
MIRNGLYHISVEMLDGIQGGNQGVMVVRDGTLKANAQGARPKPGRLPESTRR